MANQGLKGSFQLSGRLTHGFSITDLNYQGDRFITRLKADDITLESQLKWSKNFTHIAKFGVRDSKGQIITARGSLPPTSLTSFHTDISRTIVSQIQLKGTFENPTLNGDLQISELRQTRLPELQPSKIKVDLLTQNKNLNIQGSISEPGGDLLTLDGGIAFRLKEWIRNPEELKNSKFTLQAQSPKIRLERIHLTQPRGCRTQQHALGESFSSRWNRDQETVRSSSKIKEEEN